MKNIVLKFGLMIGFTAFLFSCGSKTENNSEMTEEATEAPMDVVEEPAQEAVCIWNDNISIRETADPKGKWVTSISIGEKVELTGDAQTVTISGKDREYLKIKLQDGKEGWMRTDFLSVGGTIAAIKSASVSIYKRPDILTKTDKEFFTMDIVAIVKEKGDWLQVKGKRTGGSWFEEGWIKKTNSTTEEINVAVAVFYNKALRIKDTNKQKSELQSIVNNADFSTAIFIGYISEMIDNIGMEGEN